MRFLDRRPELGRLDRLARSRPGGLAVVTGRRRVGKTRLLVEWVDRHAGIYWVADESAAAVQRRSLAVALSERLPGFADVEYAAWAPLFARLAREAKASGWRGPLVLDEIPYVVLAAPEVSSALQTFVDHGGRDARFTLALSGSSQRMMQGLALAGNAPLYGRAREMLRLAPIPPSHIVRPLGRGDAARGAEAWAAWGGIPRYWELAAGFRDVRAAVETLVLDPLGPLHDEPARLLLEELPPAVALRPVLDAIGAGAHRVSEIGARVGQPATSLSRPLTRLQELGLVERELPFGEPEVSSKRALYKIVDPFFRLWFSMVAPKRSVLLRSTRAERLRLFDAAWPRLRSLAWEELCRRAASRLASGPDSAAYGPAARFWAGSGPEWDVVAMRTDRPGLFVGEAKWPKRAPRPGEVDRMAHDLVGKGAPRGGSGLGLAGGDVRHGVFLPRLPPRRGKSVPRGVRLFDAEDVMGAVG